MRWLLHNSWAILLIISGLLFAHALYLRYAPDYHHHHGNQWETTFQFDEELSAPLPPALKLDPKARLTLVALLPSDAFTNRVQYLGSLHRVHGGNGLTVIGVAPARRLRTATPQLPFDVVADSGSAIHATFRVPPEHGHGGVVLFDSERRVKFHAFGIPEQDELRQLVEKHLLGEVDYSYRTRRWGAIKAGEPLPVASFTRVGGDGGSPDARNRLLVLLPPGCASCQIDFLASQVSAAAGKAAGRKPAVVLRPSRTHRSGAA